MSTTSHRHGNLIPDAQEIVHGLSSRVDNDGRGLAVGVGVAGTLVDDEGARRQGSRDGMRVVGEILGVVHEGAQRIVAPPGRALLRVLQRLVLPAHRVVPVGTQSLHARAHGHRERYALVEQARCQRALPEARAPRHAHAGAVDFGHGHVQGVDYARESPGPAC